MKTFGSQAPKDTVDTSKGWTEIRTYLHEFPNKLRYPDAAETCYA